jgi:hypothetical protein
MTHQLKALGARAGAFAVIGSTALFAGSANAACPDTVPGSNGADPLQQGVNCSAPSGKAGTATLFGNGGIFQTVANTLIFIVAAVSVIMLIVGGLRYVLSGGESSAVKGAKDTILYAIIGIVVAALAFAAVTFVTTAVLK